MLKLLTTCAVLCAFLFAKSKASYNVRDLQLENSFTFASNVNEHTVWLTETSLNLNSTDQNLKPCTMAINKDEILIRKRMQAKAFPSGHKFVVWGVRSYRKWRVSKYRGGLDTKYTVLLVDPWTCSYKSVIVPMNKRNLTDNYDDVLVVTNTDSFDVFLPGQPDCSPCRFDSDGEKIELKHQIEFLNTELDPLVPPRGILIHPMHPIDRKNGYFVARNFKNNTAVIMHVDQDFKTLKQLYLNHPVHSVSVGPVNDLLFSICYAPYNHYSERTTKNFTVICQQLDSNFQHKITIHYAPRENHVIYGMLHLTHQMDPLGNIYIGGVESTVEEHEGTYKYQPRVLRFFACDKSGNFLQSQDFDIIVEAKTMTLSYSDHYKQFFLHSHLLVGDKFCLVNDEFVSKSDVKVHKLDRCFDIHN